MMGQEQSDLQLKWGGALIGGLWAALRSPNDRLMGFLSGAAVGLTIGGAILESRQRKAQTEAEGKTKAETQTPDTVQAQAWNDVLSGELLAGLGEIWPDPIVPPPISRPTRKMSYLVNKNGVTKQFATVAEARAYCEPDMVLGDVCTRSLPASCRCRPKTPSEPPMPPPMTYPALPPVETSSQCPRGESWSYPKSDPSRGSCEPRPDLTAAYMDCLDQKLRGRLIDCEPPTEALRQHFSCLRKQAVGLRIACREKRGPTRMFELMKEVAQFMARQTVSSEPPMPPPMTYPALPPVEDPCAALLQQYRQCVLSKADMKSTRAEPMGKWEERFLDQIGAR